MTHLTSHHELPPFAEGIPTAPLVSISLAKLEAGDKAESDAFFKASKELGFFYLNMNGSKLGEDIVVGAEALNKLQKVFFKMSNEEKDKYGRDKIDKFYAYRYAELAVKDENGVPLRSESYNLRKDDVLGNCERLPCPPMILENQELFKSYVINCRKAIDLMIDLINDHLKLPPGTLAQLHRLHERSGDHVRFTQNMPQPFDEERAKRAEHTDFGTFTILFNWLGGLQIRHPETNEWIYVRPIPGSCVVNLGDAMVKFTAGILRSNIHRVVPPVGEQANLVRNSLVYFSRPEDSVVMKRLQGGIIDDQPKLVDEEEMNSNDWIYRRSLGDLYGIYTLKGFEKREVAVA